MFEWLEGKLLPQIVSEGGRYLLLMRPQERMVAVLGGQSAGRDAVWNYHHSQAVSQSLERHLGRAI